MNSASDGSLSKYDLPRQNNQNQPGTPDMGQFIDFYN
jgi:hypothetical protein